MARRPTEPEILQARRRSREAYRLLAPALVLLAVFFAYPILWLLYVSTTVYNPVTSTSRTVWLAHYSRVLSSPEWWRSILNMAYFAGVYVPVTLAVAGVLALLLRRGVAGRPFLKAVFCSPCAVPVVAAALIWRAGYLARQGPIDRLLYMAGYDHPFGWAGWLAEPYLAMPCIALMCVWRDAGLVALILLSALGRIPVETYEMARVDGASRWQQFRSITLPLCGGTFGLCLILLVINVQALFQEIYVMTEDGGPANWTVSIPFLVYRKAYIDYEWGQAAALSVVLFALTVVIIVIQNRLLSRRLDWS
ncbi:MAG: sugar ABC transporter permease [Planctomycetota bacterium]